MNTTVYFRFVALFVAAFFSLLHPMASVKSDRRFNVVRVLPGDLSGDGLQVYERIRELHQAAFLLGEDTRVEYPHKMEVDIEIPSGATPIPLTRNTDFNGCTFCVENTSVDNLFLFSMDRRNDLQDNETVEFETLAQAARRITVSGDIIDGGDFSSMSVLAQGHKLLYVYDSLEWSTRRNLKIYRRDIIHIVDGKAQNRPIQPYTNSAGLICLYDDVDENVAPSFENLSFRRQSSSSKRTFLLKANGQIGLQIRGISIYTPREDSTQTERPIYGFDQCLYVRHSVNTLFEDIHVDGTYSAKASPGYALRMINLANTSIREIRADGAWGVTCGFYLNSVTLDGCVINRFDCHCYCADFVYRNCTICTGTEYFLGNSYCQLANAHGYMFFSHCRFVGVRPIVIDSSYSTAFSGFELIYQDCDFELSSQFYYLLEGLTYDDSVSQRSLPNLKLRDCRFCLPDNFPPNRICLFHFNNQADVGLYRDTVEYLTHVDVENVRILPESKSSVPVFLCNKNLTYRQDFTSRVLNSSFDALR